MTISLARIRSFIEVAAQKQFRKASENLGLSQPALSAQISALEHELGVALFSRTTRSVRLTVEGERFLTRTQAVLKDLEVAVAELRDQASLRYGRVSLAATPSIMASVVPQAIAAFRARFPDVQVTALEETSVAVQRRVEACEVDFGIGPCPRERSELLFSCLFRDRFVGILPIGHKFANRRHLTLAQLTGQPLITTVPETNVYDLIKQAFEQRGEALDARSTFVQHQTVVAMVAAGLGVALLPSHALAALDCRNVVVVTITDPEISRDIGVIKRKGGDPSSACHEFLQVLKTWRRDVRPIRKQSGATSKTG